MTKLIAKQFNELKKNNQKALIPFLTAHFPNRTVFNELLHQLPDHGASIIEIGIPFSDPMADGVVIQKTSEIAIKNGFNLRDLFDDINKFKSKFPSVPIIFMTYLNPLIQYGMDAFLLKSKEISCDGLLIVDLPPENAHHVISNDYDLDMIRLVTPTTTESRLPIIQESAGGFIYYVSVKGVTGTKKPNPHEIKSHLDNLRNEISLPIVIGFGINSTEIAEEMAAISDGVVIGSSLIKPFIDSSPDKYQTVMKDQLIYLDQLHRSINA